MESSYSVYQIQNLENGKCYIGKTTNFAQRKTHHKSFLRRGKHDNDHLQKAWNKYGEEYFEFKVLQTFSTRIQMDIAEELLILEQQTYLPHRGYNIQLGGLSDKPSERGLEKLREKGKLQMKPVQQYDLQGNLLAEYESLSQACEVLGISNTSLITRNCQGMLKSVKGFQFKYKTDNKAVLPITSRRLVSESIPVIQLKDGEVVSRYECVQSAVEQNNFAEDNAQAVDYILRCARGNFKSAYGYCWIYEKDFVY